MRIAKLSLATLAATTLLAGCAGGDALYGRDRPDEFAVTRAAPLVVPPDFALTPPRPGEATPSDARTQAIEALFGGPAPRSAAETTLLNQSDADRAAPGARSVVGSPETVVVDKGEVTRTILALPEGAGQEATVSTPQ